MAAVAAVMRATAGNPSTTMTLAMAVVMTMYVQFDRGDRAIVISIATATTIFLGMRGPMATMGVMTTTTVMIASAAKTTMAAPIAMIVPAH